MPDAQNEIQRVQESFRKSWSRHPVLILCLLAVRSGVFTVPLMFLGLHLLDSTSPMFVIASLLDVIGNSVMAFTGFENMMKNVVAAVLESFLLFLSLLTICSVAQTCAIIQIALNIWLEELRNRIKETKTLVPRTWMVLNGLHGKLELVSVLSNCLWSSTIIPGGIVLVVLQIVGALYCTLCLHGHLPPVVYAFFPILSAFMLGGILFGVFGELSKVNRNSHVYIQEMANEGMRALWERNPGDQDMKNIAKKARAFKSFGIKSAKFGYIKAST